MVTWCMCLIVIAESCQHLTSSPIRRTLHWHHNERDGISNHRRLDVLFNRLFRRSPKKTSKLRVTGLCEGNSLVTGEFPSQRASNAENVSICWRHHDYCFDEILVTIFDVIDGENVKVTLPFQCYYITICQLHRLGDVSKTLIDELLNLKALEMSTL